MSQEARNEQIKARILAGETLQAVGNSWGLTRERVRQIVAGMGIVDGFARYSLRACEFGLWLKQDSLAWLLAYGKKCFVCGGPVLRIHGQAEMQTCSHKCYAKGGTSTALRWKVPSFRAAHELRIARWNWRNRKDLPISTVRLAAKKLGKKMPPLKQPGVSKQQTERWRAWRKAHGRTEVP